MDATAFVMPGERKGTLLRSPGELTVTLQGHEKHFTYRVEPAPRRGRPMDRWWVFVLNGSDNTADYGFVGGLYERGFFWSERSRISKDAPSVRAFSWFVRNPESVEVKALLARPCIRCGRALTTPESVLRGYGPECLKRVQSA